MTDEEIINQYVHPELFDTLLQHQMPSGHIRIKIGKHFPTTNEDGYEYLHRIIMMHHLKRILHTNEHVHHIDENPTNNNIDNLEILTPSEHARLHIAARNYNKNTRQIIILNDIHTTCKQCNISFITKNLNKIFCSDKCYKISIRKCIRPSKEELLKLIWELPTIHVAKIFNVSDKAVEKWCKSYNIPKPPRGYWAKRKAGLIT